MRASRPSSQALSPWTRAGSPARLRADARFPMLPTLAGRLLPPSKSRPGARVPPRRSPCEQPLPARHLGAPRHPCRRQDRSSPHALGPRLGPHSNERPQCRSRSGIEEGDRLDSSGAFQSGITASPGREKPAGGANLEGERRDSNPRPPGPQLRARSALRRWKAGLRGPEDPWVTRGFWGQDPLHPQNSADGRLRLPADPGRTVRRCPGSASSTGSRSTCTGTRPTTLDRISMRVTRGRPPRLTLTAT